MEYNTTKQGRKNLYALISEEICQNWNILDHGWTDIKAVQSIYDFAVRRVSEIECFHGRYSLITFGQMTQLLDENAMVINMAKAILNFDKHEKERRKLQ